MWTTFLICYRSKFIHVIERHLQKTLNKWKQLVNTNGFKFGWFGRPFLSRKVGSWESRLEHELLTTTTSVVATREQCSRTRSVGVYKLQCIPFVNSTTVLMHNTTAPVYYNFANLSLVKLKCHIQSCNTQGTVVLCSIPTEILQVTLLRCRFPEQFQAAWRAVSPCMQPVPTGWTKLSWDAATSTVDFVQ